MIIWGLLLFISGCIIADTARQYDDRKWSGHTFCDLLKTNIYSFGSTDARCGHLVGATVCPISYYILRSNVFIFVLSVFFAG
jgi:hypothetical protein